MEYLRHSQQDNRSNNAEYTEEYFVRLGFTKDEAMVFVPRWNHPNAEQIAVEASMGLVRRDYSQKSK